MIRQSNIADDRTELYQSLGASPPMSQADEIKRLAQALRDHAMTPEEVSALLDSLADSFTGFTTDRSPISPLLETTDLSDGSQAESLTEFVISPRTLDNRYEMEGEIARGGMGVVIKARDLQLGRDVAIKRLNAKSLKSNNRQERIERFLAEAQITGQLEHPGIVPIYEIGVSSEETPFYAMQLVRGQTLSDAMADYHEMPMSDKRKPLVWQQLLQAYVGVCEAIAYAHSRGVLHRDLKPSNVMLGDFGEAVLIDWGLAGVKGHPVAPLDTEHPSDPNESFPTKSARGMVRADARQEGNKTQIGRTVGTPSYMSPEQARGLTDRLDATSDVFSLGVILYELLSSKLPYVGKTRDELLRQAALGRFVPPRTYASGVPRALEAICLKAMEFKQSDRYPSAKAIVEDIRRWQADEPVSVYTDRWTTRARRWMKRHRTLVSVGASVALVMSATSLAFAAIEQRRVDRVESQARMDIDAGRVALDEKRYENAIDALNKAQALIQNEPALANLLPFVTPLREGAMKENESRLAREKAERRIVQFEKDRNRALFEGTILADGDAATSLDRAKSSIDSALAAWREGDRPIHEVISTSTGLTESEKEEVRSSCRELLFAKAHSVFRASSNGPIENQQAGVSESLGILDETDSLGSSIHAVHARRAQYLAFIDRREEAEVEQKKKESLPPSIALDFFVLGEDALAEEDYSHARDLFERVLDVDPTRASAYYMMALCDLRMNRWSEAVVELTACESNGFDFIGIPLLRAFARSELGDLEAAEAEFARAEAASPEESGVYHNRGVARLRHGRIADAIADFEKAINLRPNVPGLYVNLAEAKRLEGDLATALHTLNDAIERFEHHPELLRARARIELTQSNHESAKADLNLAIEHESVPRRQARDVLELGRIAHLDGQYETALAHYRQALTLDSEMDEAERRSGMALVDLGRLDEAVKSFDQYLTRVSHKPETLSDQFVVYRERGLAKMRLRDLVGGMTDLARSMDADSKNDDAEAVMLGRRGWTYLNQGPELAKADFERILRDQPDNTDALLGIAYARTQLGDAAGAIRAADRAISLDPKNPDLNYNASCVFAQCVICDPKHASSHRIRSIQLLDVAYREWKADERPALMQMIESDRAFVELRSTSAFQEWKAKIDGR